MDKYFKHLDNLRESGEINMYEAHLWLANEFDLTKSEAKVIVQEWMETY